MIDNGAIERGREIGPSAFMVYAAIARHADERRRAWPGIDRLAELTGLSRRTVQIAIATLRQAGWITVDGSRGRVNTYILPPMQSSAMDCATPEQSSAMDCAGVAQPVALGSAMDCAGGRNQLRPNKTNITRKEQDGRAPAKRFVVPTISEVTTYCSERKNQVDPQRFLDYYESNGWRVGRNGMKDWRAAVRTWERNGFSGANGQAKKPAEPIKYRN